MDIKNLTIKKAREMLDKKEVSVKDLVLACTSNIEDKNKDLNVFLEVYKDILDQVEVAQGLIDRGESKSLTGIPLSIKDNILIKGKVASAASKILENYKATYNATVSQKIIDEGGIFLGRVNMDEFACGGSTENSAYGVTRNPLDPSRVSGGSSGGSAASVASYMSLGSLGSDTGGSVREPASFCGVVGLKPTYGSVSRYGLMAMGSSLDVVGPIAKTVSDVEIIWNVIKGKDKMDSTSIDITPPTPSYIKRGKDGKMKIGVPRHLLDGEGINPEVKKNFDEAVVKLGSLGFEIVDVELKNLDKSLAVYYIIMPAELSSNLSRFDAIKYGMSIDGSNLLEVYKKTRGEGFGKEIRRRIILGTYVLSSGYYDAYYGKAMIARKIIKSEFDSVFSGVDAIITPTTPDVAWKIGEKADPLSMYLADVFTVGANIAGIPAMSIPSGNLDVDGKNLPLGLQIMASHNNENILFEIGKKFLGE